MNTEFNPQDLTPSVSIEALLLKRDAILERYRSALQLIIEAQDIAKDSGLGDARFLIEESRGGRHSLSDAAAPELIRQNVDARAWAHLMHESGLRSFLDAKARSDWDKNIAAGSVPCLSLQNIVSTFGAIHAARDEYFERGVIEVFKKLSWDYKTNQPFRFGKRIILNHLVSVWGNPKDKHVTLNHRTADELDDLVRIFSVLDGKPEPDHRAGMYAKLSPAIRDAVQDVDTEYFSVRWFFKGTGHLTFKRPPLVDALNAILAKHYPGALAAPREAR